MMMMIGDDDDNDDNYNNDDTVCDDDSRNCCNSANFQARTNLDFFAKMQKSIWTSMQNLRSLVGTKEDVEKEEWWRWHYGEGKCSLLLA